MIFVHQDSWGRGMSIGLLLALVLSWAYVSTITLTASILFHLVCNLQVIHFDDFGRLLERESDVLVFVEEHIRLRYHLCKISHRFRIFLLLQFIVVTASQFVTLFETTGYGGEISVVNGGDFAVSSTLLRFLLDLIRSHSFPATLALRNQPVCACEVSTALICVSSLISHHLQQKHMAKYLSTFHLGLLILLIRYLVKVYGKQTTIFHLQATHSTPAVPLVCP